MTLSCRQCAPSAERPARVPGGHHRRGPRPAGGAVVGTAGAEDEVSGVGVRPSRRRGEFDVVDLGAGLPGDSLVTKRGHDAPRDTGEVVHLRQRER